MDEQTIRTMYNMFSEPRNMTYTEFRKEMLGLTDPVAMQRDLRDIELQKARHRTNKIRIDKAMGN